MLKCKEFETELPLPVWRYNRSSFREGQRKITKNPGQDSRCPGRRSNGARPRYKSGVTAGASINVNTFQFKTFRVTNSF
jgi:hypothetical protein